MGRSITPKYRVIVDGQEMVWDCKRYGKPNEANLGEYVYRYAKSLESGGVNEHISKMKGYIPYPRKAHIEYNMMNGSKVAQWEAPSFMCW